MAQSNKGNSYNFIFLALMVLLPILQVTSLQDNTLLSRFLVLDLFGLATFVFLRKDLKDLSLNAASLISLGAFSLLLLFAAFTAHNTSEGWGALARYFSFLPLFILLQVAFRRKRLQPKNLLQAAVLFAALAALPTLFQLFKSLASGDFFADIYTITGTFSHKNLLASALMLSFPFVLAAWAALDKMWSKAAMFLALLIIVELFVLRTRGVWLGLIGASFISALFLKWAKNEALQINRKWTIILASTGLLILVALFLSPQIKAGFTNSSNVQKRLVFWENSLEMVQENPISGVGLGNWRLFFPKYGLQEVDENTRQGITHIQRPHNDFLWVWAEAGPIALLALLSIYLLAFRQVAKNLRSLSGSEVYLQAAALFSLLAYGIFSFGDFPIERAPHTLWWMLSLAIIFYPSKAKVKAEIPTYLGTGLLLVALFINWQRFKAEQGMSEVLKSNANRNVAAIIPAADQVYSEWYKVDNFANPVRYYSGKGYLFSQRRAEALRDLQIAMEDAPYNILVYDALAQYYAQGQKLDQALDYAAQGLAISPQFKPLLLLSAEIHLQRKDFAEALALLNRHEPRSQDRRYMQDLAGALRGALNTYEQHGRFAPMMEHLKNSGPLNSPEDYLRAYRQKRGI